MLFLCYKSDAQNANTALSNLVAPTKVNVHLLPDKDATRNLGSAIKNWKNFYFDSTIYVDSIPFISVKTGTGANNTAVGLAALTANTTGTNNTGIGFNTLMNNTTGRSNTAFGSQAMGSAIASYNTAVGAYALANSQADNNTAVGYSTMIYNSTGSNNTATGYYAMHANIDGDDNTATGNQALSANTDGVNNVATGSFALWQNTNGGANTAVGTEALYNTTTGGSNTALGNGAGYNVRTGSNNIFIGSNANCGTTGALTNSAAIGYNVTITTNNSFIIGNADVNRWGFGVDAGLRAIKVGTTSANGNGAYLTQGGVWTNTSARNKKEDFQQQDKNLILQKINQLEITRWKYKGTEKEYHYGPMADDFHRLFNVDDDSSIADMDKTGVLFLGMQQLIKINAAKDASIDSLKSEIRNLKSEMEELKMLIVAKQSTTLSSALLQQNIPNPFSNSTTINYSIPQQFSSAKIIITDKNGNALKEIKLLQNKGASVIEAGKLASGAYQYSLYVDGRLIDTKQMEHFK